MHEYEILEFWVIFLFASTFYSTINNEITAKLSMAYTLMLFILLILILINFQISSNFIGLKDGPFYLMGVHYSITSIKGERLFAEVIN